MKKVLTYLIFIVVVVMIVPFAMLKNYTGNDRERGVTSCYKYISVYNTKEDRVMYMSLEEYIKCVVASEMPALYEIEALKAQAIAARTFVYKRISENNLDSHKGAVVCTDFRHCQAYLDKDEILAKWGDDDKNNWQKISTAVEDTSGKVICYKDELILPVFHSNSVDKTESSGEIWSCVDIPYLRSVKSFGKDIVTSMQLTVDEFRERLIKNYPDVKFSDDVFSDIKGIERNESNRVRFVKISGIVIKGEKFREIFSLKSTNFKIVNIGNNKLRIESYGSGHGVGLCQVGANEMAKVGKRYDDIIRHYYRGVDILDLFVNKFDK